MHRIRRLQLPSISVLTRRENETIAEIQPVGEHQLVASIETISHWHYRNRFGRHLPTSRPARLVPLSSPFHCLWLKIHRYFPRICSFFGAVIIKAGNIAFVRMSNSICNRISRKIDGHKWSDECGLGGHVCAAAHAWHRPRRGKIGRKDAIVTQKPIVMYATQLYEQICVRANKTWANGKPYEPLAACSSATRSPSNRPFFFSPVILHPFNNPVDSAWFMYEFGSNRLRHGTPTSYAKRLPSSEVEIKLEYARILCAADDTVYVPLVVRFEGRSI